MHFLFNRNNKFSSSFVLKIIKPLSPLHAVWWNFTRASMAGDERTRGARAPATTRGTKFGEQHTFVRISIYCFTHTHWRFYHPPRTNDLLVAHERLPSMGTPRWTQKLFCPFFCAYFRQPLLSYAPPPHRVSPSARIPARSIAARRLTPRPHSTPRADNYSRANHSIILIDYFFRAWLDWFLSLRWSDPRRKTRGQKSCLESLRVPGLYLLPAAEIRARSYWLQPNSQFGSIDSYSPKPPMIRNRTSNLSVLGHYYFAATAPAPPRRCFHWEPIPNAWIKPAKHFGRAALRSGCARLAAFSLFPHFPIGATQFDQYWHCAQPVNCTMDCVFEKSEIKVLIWNFICNCRRAFVKQNVSKYLIIS